MASDAPGHSRRSDRIASVVILVVSAFYMVEARTFRPFLRTEPLGPATFPLVIGGMMLLLAAILLVTSFRNGSTAGAQSVTPRARWTILRPILLWVLLAAYARFFSVVGFPLGTLAFLFLSFWLLGVRWFQAAALAVIFTAAGWYGFRALDVRLPIGDLLR